MKHELDRVKLWNLNFGEPMKDPENEDRSDIPEALLEKRAAFVLEESKETLKGLIEDDMVEVLDGLADIGFVSAGTALALGLTIDAPVYQQVLNKMLISACERLAEGLKKKDWPYITLVLAEIEVIYRGIAGIYGLPYMAAFEEVFNSNMTKKDKNGKVIRNEVGKIMKPDTYVKPDIQGVLNRSGWSLEKVNV